MDSFRRMGLALAGAVLLLCFGAAPKPSQTPQDLVGSWQLNEDLSQAAHPMRPGGGERGRMGGGRPPGGGPPRDGGGGGRPGPRPGGRPGGGEGQRPPLPPGQIVAMAGGATSLQIEADGPRLTVIYGGDRHLLFTDGRKIRKEQEEGEEIIQRTRWREEHLEIETTAGRAKVTELWVLTNDRKRIFATVEMERPGGGRKMNIRRVWDRTEPAP